MPELIKLLRTKSMMRYFPPNGTAGLARSLVSGERRLPLPPASTIPKTLMRIADQSTLFQASVSRGKQKVGDCRLLAVRIATMSEMIITITPNAARLPDPPLPPGGLERRWRRLRLRSAVRTHRHYANGSSGLKPFS